MIWESFQQKGNEPMNDDPSRGFTLIFLSIATSIDAAAVGFTLAALQIPILFPSAIIGLTCVLLSAIGLYLGNKIGFFIGNWAERLGGIILIGIGLKILIQNF
jgi:putative Mn2+ efflux pump MntP